MKQKNVRGGVNNMNQPLLSICIPTYHRGKTVYNTVKSILENNIDFIEVVVSDNASPDDTKELLASIRDERLKYFRNNENIGGKNIFKVPRLGIGKWRMLLSDEDCIKCSDWEGLRIKLESNSDVGIYRTRVYDEEGGILTDGPMEKRYAGTYEGYQYVRGYTNYISGIIYRGEQIEDYSQRLDTDMYFFMTYNHIYLAIQYMQEWNCDRIPELETYMGEDNGDVYTDMKTTVPKKGILVWGEDGRKQLAIDTIDIWARFDMKDSLRQKLMLHAIVSAIRDTLDIGIWIRNKKIISQTMFSGNPDALNYYRELNIDEWDMLVNNNKKEIENKVMEYYSKPDAQIWNDYIQEINNVIYKGLNELRNVI